MKWNEKACTSYNTLQKIWCSIPRIRSKGNEQSTVTVNHTESGVDEKAQETVSKIRMERASERTNDGWNEGSRNRFKNK